MGVLWIMLGSAALLVLAGRYYAPVIGRILGERPDRPTPAVLRNDGRDFVPTQTPVVFAHHYASIAGAGPIIGPVLAIYYGWGPALLWILLGGIFLGAVHDYVATHVAMREGGVNLSVVTRRYIGQGAFVMMVILLVALLVLVCAAFLDLSAKALTSKVATETLGLPANQTLFRTTRGVTMTAADAHLPAGETPEALLARFREIFGERKHSLSDSAELVVVAPAEKWRISDQDRTYYIERRAGRLEVQEQQAIIGGIASTSVVVITLFSPVLGWLYLKRKVAVWACSILALAICALSIIVGLYLPMAVTPMTWKLLISGYVLIAAGLPVWLFLQSRDFINVHILYFGIAFLIVALVAAAIRGGGQFMAGSSIPLNNWTEGSAKLGPGWPMLFVIIACGAVSGFHSLCAGGTTCKQLRTEPDGRRVGYYAMLLESFLAVCVVCCLIVGLSKLGYAKYAIPGGQGGNAVLAFAMAVGHTAHVGLNLPIAVGALGAMLLLEGFLVTTLDTAIRLTRYMIEEGWATFFGRYDVFAAGRAGEAESAAKVADPRVPGEIVGTGGMSAVRPAISYAREVEAGRAQIGTSGAFRAFLLILRQYWVNSGIAVALMLLLALTGGYSVVWRIFGSSNQLLAALSLVVGTCWLVARGRPVWYTLLPAIFMLVTSITALSRELWLSYLPGWPRTAPLAITAILVLIMTAGILASAVHRWVHLRRPAAAAA